MQMIEVIPTLHCGFTSQAHSKTKVADVGLNLHAILPVKTNNIAYLGDSKGGSGVPDPPLFIGGVRKPCWFTSL